MGDGKETTGSFCKRKFEERLEQALTDTIPEMSRRLVRIETSMKERCARHSEDIDYCRKGVSECHVRIDAINTDKLNLTRRLNGQLIAFIIAVILAALPHFL